MNVPVTRYDTVVPTRRRPTTSEDLHRLAGLARDRGIRLFLAAVAPTCRTCRGRGFDPACTGHPTAAGVVTCECPRCGGSGRRPAPRPIIAVDFEPVPLAA